MEFITTGQFIAQPKEVQKVFLNWWKPNVGDLFSWVQPRPTYPELDFTNLTTFQMVNADIMASIEMDNWAETCKFYKEATDYCVPLLTEGQLRKFIEDKIQCKVETVYISKEFIEDEKSYYRIQRSQFIDGDINDSVWITDTDNLIEAYWQTACKLAIK